MYVDWEYYKIFYYVAKYQNFTKAARVLGNNQPNITHSMNRLEMFRHQREVLTQQIQQLQHTLETVEYKCWFYEAAKAAGTVDVPAALAAS